MMEKHYNTFDAINKIICDYYQKAFKTNLDFSELKIVELTGGFKNEVYLIEHNDEKLILKLSSMEKDNILVLENGAILWEAQVLKKLENEDFIIPKVLYCGKDSIYSYIFMSYINGYNFYEIKKSMKIEEIYNVEYNIGKICAKISENKSERFYIPYIPNFSFDNNYDFVWNLFKLLLSDAKKYSIELNYDLITDLIQKCKEQLCSIKESCLVGMIDLSELYYCDYLMTFYFHDVHNSLSNGFFDGYGKKEFDDNELIRINIYRLFLSIKMLVEQRQKNIKMENVDWLFQKTNKYINQLIEMNGYVKIKKMEV